MFSLQSRSTRRRTALCFANSNWSPPAPSWKYLTNAMPPTPSGAFSIRSCCREVCRTKERRTGKKETVPMGKVGKKTRKGKTVDAARAAPAVDTGKVFSLSASKSVPKSSADLELFVIYNVLCLFCRSNRSPREPYSSRGAQVLSSERSPLLAASSFKPPSISNMSGTCAILYLLYIHRFNFCLFNCID